MEKIEKQGINVPAFLSLEFSDYKIAETFQGKIIEAAVLGGS